MLVRSVSRLRPQANVNFTHFHTMLPTLGNSLLQPQKPLYQFQCNMLEIRNTYISGLFAVVISETQMRRHTFHFISFEIYQAFSVIYIIHIYLAQFSVSA